MSLSRSSPGEPQSVAPGRPGIEPVRAGVSAAGELAALYAHAPMGFAVLDTELRFLRVNDWLAAVNGLPASAHVGRRVHELLPTLAAQAESALRHVLTTGSALLEQAVVGETPAVPGALRSWREHWLPIHGPGGGIVAVGVLVEETTELHRNALEARQAAAALAASEARHEFLLRLYDRMRVVDDPQELVFQACELLGERLALNRVGLAEFDADARRVLVSRHYTDGVPQSEGLHEAGAFGESLVASLRAGVTQVASDVRRSGSLEEPARRAHLAWETEAFVIVPVFDGGRLSGAFFANVRTPRDWTRDEIALVEAFAHRVHDAFLRARDAQRLRLAQEAAGIGIFDYDLVTDVRRWDAQLHRLWGLPPGVPLTTGLLRATVPPEDLPEVDAAIARAQDPAGPGSAVFEHRVRRPSDGREVRLLMTARVQFRDRVPVRMVGTAQDVTGPRENERILRDADQRKDEFLAMLAHELRNPLAPLRNTLHYLGRAALPEPCREAVERATRQVRHMTRLVDDLLEVSRISRGVIRLLPERVRLQDVLRSAVEPLAPVLEQRRQRLVFEWPPAPLWVDADPTRLVQVIENLLTNASKYSEPGSTLTIRAGGDDREVHFEVCDPGIGLAPEHLTRVFELFTQVDSAIERSQGGLGIGLGLVKRLVEAHGGRVTAASDGLGRGARFTVWLPASGADDGRAPDGAGGGAAGS